MKEIEIRFPKLYRYDREREHVNVAIPFAKGELKEAETLHIYENGVQGPVQSKVTSLYEDGSIRYIFARFLANLPANGKHSLTARIESGEPDNKNLKPLSVSKNGAQITVSGGLTFAVSDDSEYLFDYLFDGRKRYDREQFVGPALTDGNGSKYGVYLGKWNIVESGPLVSVLRVKGFCKKEVSEGAPTFELKLTAYAEKPWVEISYRIINSTDERLHIKSLVFGLLADQGKKFNPVFEYSPSDEKGDSVGEGNANRNAESQDALSVLKRGGVVETTGIKELGEIEKAVESTVGRAFIRTCAGNSNYKTNFSIAAGGKRVSRVIDAKHLVGEANEHYAEVFYGTFFADRTDAADGVCATIFQAQQNYPKAVSADESGIYVMLVPEGVDSVVMESGMSREQRFLLHFHDPKESLTEIDNRSLIYQMPDKPSISSDVFRAAGVMPDIFVDRDRINNEVEIALISRADGHGRAYGMLNFGDAPDMGYTKQGRGKGKLVWANNEYDYPHSCALIYARTGVRRFQDYLIASASHWMDVDVCHYSKNPLNIGGQWEHTRNHVVDSTMVCSHEWVEGLFDYYHFTGDERALETAIGIGENVLRLLETPMYQTSGESNARETGWALRTLTALYVETHDKRWLAKCDWILGHFKEWVEEYGEWIAPYTDNTLIRVGFMISVAVGSIIRYYRVFPDAEIKKLLLSAIDDLVDNCLMDNGLFYYKELPSLDRLGNNTLLLEAMAVGYELTKDAKYLRYGLPTFKRALGEAQSGGGVSDKRIVEDAVILNGGSPKNFGQSFIPLSVFYKAAADNGLL